MRHLGRVNARQAREKRIREEEAAAQRARRESRRRKILAVWGVAVLLAVVAIVISQVGSGEKASDFKTSGQEAAQLFQGIEQDGARLGEKDAPIQVSEFADLQCPFCAAFAREDLEELLPYVRSGEVSLSFMPLTFLGEDSKRLALLVAAAGEQDKLWQTTHVAYAHQGVENSGYADEQFLADVATSVPGLDADKALKEAPGQGRLLTEAQAASEEASVTGTPSFLVEGEGINPQLVSQDEIVSVIDDLVG